ncbi:hypothetical protein JDN40_18020 [Rhodomicrobium vannielii ATCC 17100]|uniref:hypothetical protein n=1 Tax=Rhodomicrobium vannielii TaxID=1069 RepID=UPI00191A57DF|nr:hypothetical protein [Rhodomicrobium vannielii]MBJ7536009.1 hypothetical protein [Rhodomicrobium vannielii ATCC 17100]
MARSTPFLGVFGRFGRSESLRTLDKVLRAVDLHPNLVPEAVKLTVVSLLMDAYAEDPREPDYRHAAELIGYVALGADGFTVANGEAAANDAERRIEAALADEDSLDAKLILLALHSSIVHPALKEAWQLESD